MIGRTVANSLRVTLEIGLKGKKVVAVAPDWPGLERGATNGEAASGAAAIERILAYVPRYAAVAKLAGMEAVFPAITGVNVVVRYPGTGSADFWGISFAYSSIDQRAMSDEALERELTLMRASGRFSMMFVPLCRLRCSKGRAAENGIGAPLSGIRLPRS